MADGHDASLVDGGDVARDGSPGPNGHPRESDAQAAGEPAEPTAVCYYGSLGEFTGWLLAVYRRSTRGQARVFCPQWWKHPEAVVRMDALWRAFEQLRQDPGAGMSVFWRDHADHHMNVLLDADGPFKGCEDGHSDHPLEPIRQDEPPAVLFQRDHRAMPYPGTEHAATSAARPQPSGSAQRPHSGVKP